MLDEKKITCNHLVPYLRNADVNWDRINVTELPMIDIEPDERERFGLKQGDILICEGGAGIGQTAIWNAEIELCAFQKALHRLRPWTDDEVPRYLYYCMRIAVETGIILAGGTATIPHLTGEQLRKYRFPKPPKAEQQAIVAFLDAETAKLDALITEAERAIELLQERRTALISAAVTGKIDVRHFASTEAA
jgi:type I restriction enzyme S subunit